MEGPRAPEASELPHVLDFLKHQLRPENQWPIEAEYPTALCPNNIHNMRIIATESQVLSHAVLRPLIIKSPQAILKVGAIGSVVTDSSHRNKGLSTQILNGCVEEAQKQECDIAILWTNLYDFYRKLGFELAGSEVSFVLDKIFSPPRVDLTFKLSSQVSAEAIHRLYSQHSVSSIRNAEEIRRFLKIPNSRVYTAWDQQGMLAAYAVEGKGADLTGYVHEWGGSVSALMSLFNFILQDQKKPITVITPSHSQNLHRALSTVAQVSNNGYLGMIKILRFESLFQKIQKSARLQGIDNLYLRKTEDKFEVGTTDEFIVVENEKALTQLIFGPFPEVDGLSDKTLTTIKEALPLPLWVWGWDSI